METTFEFCALKYLEIWHLNDEPAYRAFENKFNDENHWKNFARALTSYSIARNLPVQEDEKYKEGKKLGMTDPVKRYGKIKEILDKLDSIDDDFYIKFDDFNKDLSNYYWPENKIRTRSATSKILWLKFRNTNIKIYDSRAKKALNQWKANNFIYDDNDYKSYVEDWKEFYITKKEDVEKACNQLLKDYKYSRPGKEIDEEYVLKFYKQDWFKERVFDIYLWNKGE
jgi:hypothetical protein